MKQECSNCYYFRQGRMDTCRKFAPAVLTREKPIYSPVWSHAIWPSVDRTDWCGEWKPEKNRKHGGSSDE